MSEMRSVDFEVRSSMHNMVSIIIVLASADTYGLHYDSYIFSAID